jgi:beta-glucosidase
MLTFGAFPLRAALLAAAAFVWTGCASRGPVYQNPDAAIERRVEDLLSRMTLEEKVSQLMNDSPAIERLGVPAYNWWNECLHGVARAGRHLRRRPGFPRGHGHFRRSARQE